MHVEEQRSREFYDLLVTGGLGAIIAMIFQAAGLFRNKDKKMRWVDVFVSLINAGCVGALAAWLAEEFSVPFRLRAALIAICGRVGAPLLDILYVEVQETVKAAFDGMQKWLSEGKWDKHRRDD